MKQHILMFVIYVSSFTAVFLQYNRLKSISRVSSSAVKFFNQQNF